MLIDINTDQGFSDDRDAYYEAVASQEEIYLEETEEEVRSILISYNLDPDKIQRLGGTDFAQRENVLGPQESLIDQELTPRESESLVSDLDLATNLLPRTTMILRSAK
jgi:hypothetical protein